MIEVEKTNLHDFLAMAQRRPAKPNETLHCMRVDEGNPDDYWTETVYIALNQRDQYRVKRHGIAPETMMGMTLFPAIYPDIEQAREIAAEGLFVPGDMAVYQMNFSEIPKKSLAVKLHEDGSFRYFALVGKIKGGLLSPAEDPAPEEAPAPGPRLR